MRWTLWRRKTSGADADGEVVWSWRPDAGVKFAGSDLQATVAKEPGHRGEHEISVKTIAQGMPVDLGVPVVTNSCALFHFAREAMGVLGTRLSLRPLILAGRYLQKPRASRAARMQRRDPHGEERVFARLEP
jgi:hypothetical protein